jgi:tryptophanyl-tRNA synthetase
VQPTGSLHLGNWLGAIRNWVDLQGSHDTFFCVVDLHAITVPHDPARLAEDTLATAALYLACGIDPTRSTVFVQSQVSAHSELAGLLNCVTPLNWLERMIQFKEKALKQGDNVSVGLLDYPVLMAADILLYDAALVPVGEDQRQHLELTRDLAQRFNAKFGPTLTVPEAMIVKETAKIVDLQDPTAKMSKSSAPGCVFLLDEDAVLTKKIKSAVTDSDRDIRFDPVNKPGVANLLTMQQAITGTSMAELEASYADRGYGDLKTETAQIAVDLIAPIRRRVVELMSDKGELINLMGIGAGKARVTAGETLEKVYDAVGFVPLPR